MCPPVRTHWPYLVNTIELVLPSTYPSPQSKQQIDRFSHFRTAHGRKSLYFTMGAPFPQNCPFPWGSGPLSNLWLLGPVQGHNSNGITIVQPFLHRWLQSVPILCSGPLPIRWCWPPSNTWFLGLIQVINPNGIWIGSAVFEGLTTVRDWQTDQQTDRQTDRPTDHATRSIIMGCIFIVLQCSLIIVIII